MDIMIKNNLKALKNILGTNIRNAIFWLDITNNKANVLVKVATACIVIANLRQLITLLTAENNLEEFFECFSTVSFTGMGLLKLISLKNNERIWRHLFNQVSTLEDELLKDDTDSTNFEYESDDEDSLNISNYIEKYNKKYKFTSTILFKLYFYTVVFFIIAPFLEYYYMVLILSKDIIELPHILTGWAPLDHMGIIGYLVTIFCEITASCYSLLIHVTFDTMFAGLMIFACGQFILLRDYSERIGGSGKFCVLTNRREFRAHFRIVKCHRIHITLVNFQTYLNQILKQILAVYFMLTSVALCTVALRLQSDNLQLMELISLLLYMASSVTQLFLYCRYGDAVMNESSLTMGRGPFGAAWWCLSPSTRRELVSLGMGMSRTRRFTAGIFHSPDLPSFVQVMRTAYGYFALVRQNS